MRILVVEDERKLAQVLASPLKAEHYEVVLAPTGEDGFFRANAESFDLVLLDLMLPGRNGLEILQTLRTRQVQTPVLILTARDGVETECSAWISAPTIISSSRLPFRSCSPAFAHCCGAEFELLEYLLRHQGHVVSREMLAHDVWKAPRRATPIDNVIDVQRGHSGTCGHQKRRLRQVQSKGSARVCKRRPRHCEVTRMERRGLGWKR